MYQYRSAHYSWSVSAQRLYVHTHIHLYRSSSTLIYFYFLLALNAIIGGKYIFTTHITLRYFFGRWYLHTRIQFVSSNTYRAEGSFILFLHTVGNDYKLRFRSRLIIQY